MAWRRPGDKQLSEPMLTQFTDAYMPGRHQAFIWLKAGSVHRRIYAARGRDELTFKLIHPLYLNTVRSEQHGWYFVENFELHFIENDFMHFDSKFHLSLFQEI